ncbi:MAG TPA: hypothetical protein VFJ64_10925 [Solirubrobacterales bacterium]|nr:hypothetical protein [Solirubrobacterales bacterium]
MRRRTLLWLALAASALTLAAPAAAQAAQTLTVEKQGTGTGTLTSSPAGIECGPECQASFADATVVTLTATPGQNTAPATWAGCDSVNGENKCLVTMSSAHKVTATFDLLQRQLKVKKEGSATGTVTSSPAGINCGFTCTTTYDHGTTVTLTGAPGPNAQAAKWSGCGSVDAEDRCIVTMSAAKEVTASFSLVQRQLTVNKAGNGASISEVTSSPARVVCGSTCSAGFDLGATVTLTATPGPHTHQAQWSGCDSVNGANKCLVTMGTAREVTASFELIQFPLAVTKAGPGGPFSSVTSTPAAISCGETCQANVTEGTLVTLKGTPGVNILKASWTGCESVSKTNECIVTMSAAKEVTATFALAPGASIYTLTVEAAGTGKGAIAGDPGKIACPEACSAEVVQETRVLLTATPADGSVFDHWVGGGCANAGPCETTVKSSKTVKAIFTAVGNRTLTIAMPGPGQGAVKSKAVGINCTSSCAAELDAATKLTLTPTPAQGSAFAGFSGACLGTGVCKVTMNEARSVTATFVATSSPPPPPTPTGTAVVSAKAKVKAGKALVGIRCSGPASCRGTLKLTAKLAGKSKAIGSASFALAPGAATTLKVKLSAKALQLLKGKGKLAARVSGTGIGAHAVKLKG